MMRRTNMQGRYALLVTATIAVLALTYLATRPNPEAHPEGALISRHPADVRDVLVHSGLPEDLLPSVRYFETVGHENGPIADPERLMPPSPPEVPREDRSHAPARRFIAPEYFEQKYADASLAEVLEAHVRLEAAYLALMNTAGAARFEAGLAEESVGPRPTSYEEAALGKPSDWSPGLVMGSQTQVIPAEDGGELRRVLLTTLHYEEHRDVYDAQDEVRWLKSEISRRKQDL